MFLYVSEQETINLVSGRTCMPHASTLTLTRAILLLRDLQGGQSTALLKLLQKLVTDEVQKNICMESYTIVLYISYIQLPVCNISIQKQVHFTYLLNYFTLIYNALSLC